MWQRLKESNFIHGLISYSGLFTSLGTLVCCALPSSIVLLGFGASLASFLGEYPELIWLSENKDVVFALSSGLLVLSFISQKLAATKACPIDQREVCVRTKSWSKPLFFVSLSINLIGAFYAYLLPRLLS